MCVISHLLKNAVLVTLGELPLSPLLFSHCLYPHLFWLPSLFPTSYKPYPAQERNSVSTRLSEELVIPPEEKVR